MDNRFFRVATACLLSATLLRAAFAKSATDERAFAVDEHGAKCVDTVEKHRAAGVHPGNTLSIREQLLSFPRDPWSGNLLLICAAGAAFILTLRVLDAGAEQIRDHLPPLARSVVLALTTVGIPTATALWYRYAYIRHSGFGLVNSVGVFFCALNIYLSATIEAFSDWFIAPLLWGLAFSVHAYIHHLRRYRFRLLSPGDQVSAFAFWLASTVGLYQSSLEPTAVGLGSRVIGWALLAAFAAWLTILICGTSMFLGRWLALELPSIIDARPRPLSAAGTWYIKRLAIVYQSSSTALAVGTGVASGLFMLPADSTLTNPLHLSLTLAPFLVPLWPFPHYARRLATRAANSSPALTAADPDRAASASACGTTGP